MLDCATGHFARRGLDRCHSERHRVQSFDGPCILRKCQCGTSYRKRNRTRLLYPAAHYPVSVDRCTSAARISFLSRRCSLVRCAKPANRTAFGGINGARQGYAAWSCSDSERSAQRQREKDKGNARCSELVER